jgi:hypothetical protein
MKRKLAWVCLLVSPLVLGGIVFCILDRDPITRANFDRIRKIFRKEGMSIQGIEALLGKKVDGKSRLPGPEVCYYWEGSSGYIIAWLRNEPTAINPAVFLVEFEAREPRTILDKVRNWLGW